MLEEKVKQLFIEEGIITKEDDSETELDIDSLRFVSIIVRIEETFEVVIPDEYLSSTIFTTLGDYIELVNILISE